MKLASVIVVGLLLTLNACVTAGTIGEKVTEWPNPELVEASGLAFVRPHNLLITHNDDTDKSLYFFHLPTGQHRSVPLLETRNRDWEDITLIPASDDRGPVVVIGEIGDNGARYPNLTLYFYELLLSAPSETEIPTIDVEYLGQIPFIYDRGARDAESLAYDASQHRLLVISKRLVPAELYEIPLPDDLVFSNSPVPVTATLSAIISGIPRPTPAYITANPRLGRYSGQPGGMDIAPDGRTAAIITYNDLHLFYREEDEPWEQALIRPPVVVDVIELGQTEAVTFGRNNREVFLTTEGQSPPVLQVDLPARP